MAEAVLYDGGTEEHYHWSPGTHHPPYQINLQSTDGLIQSHALARDCESEK